MIFRKMTPALLTEYLRSVLSFLAVIFLTPLLLKDLGTLQFGIWVTFSSLIGYFGVLDLGLGSAMPKLFAEELALGNTKKLSHLMSTLFFLALMGCFVILAVVASFALPIEHFLHIQEPYLLMGRNILLILSISFSISFIANIWYGFLFGVQKLHISNLIGIFSLAVLIAIIWLALKLDYGLLGVAVANLFVNGLGFLIAFFYVKKEFPALSIRLDYFDKKLLQSALKLSFYIFIINLGGHVIYNTDNIVITKFLGIEKVAAYAIALRLCLISMNFVFNFSKIFLPVFSELQATKNEETLGRLFLQCSQIAVAIGGAFAIVLLFYGRELIYFWVGPSSFAGMATLSTLIVLLLTTPGIQTGAMVLLGMGRIRISTYMCLAEAFLNIVLSITLVQFLGIWGVALGTILAQLLTNSWFTPWYTLRQLNITSSVYLKKVLLPAWVSLLFAILLELFLHRLTLSSTLIVLGIRILLLISSYSLFYLLLLRWLRKEELPLTPALS